MKPASDYRAARRNAVKQAKTAALAMLAALKAVEKWWLEEEMQKHTGAPYAIFAVREAIAKAEGKS